MSRTGLRTALRSSTSLAIAFVVVYGLGAPAAADAPKITSFSPTSGPIGTVVTINGSDLVDVTEVDFNGTSATFTVNSSSKITATVPTGATTGKIAVVTSTGTAHSSDGFIVTPPAPTISSFSPTSGPIGTSVIINGSNFRGSGFTTTSVKFNGTSAAFTVNSSSKITATVPSGATDGKISVATPGGTATSSSSFDVTSVPSPTISSFSPTSGPVGTSVTINGSNFSGNGFTTSSVTFNNTSATSTVNSSSKITATVPSGATDGRIRVTTPGGTATSSNSFDVTTPAAPKISSFSPTSGPVGTSVTINGSNFTGATAVKFNGVSATFTVNSSSKITATVPSGATDGKISVTTPGGTATSPTSFDVIGVTHSRTVSLQLSGHLVATGLVLVADGFSVCAVQVPVKVQHYVSGRWRTVGEVLTRDDGSYRARIPNRSGRYRSRAMRIVLASGEVCMRDTSGIKLNRR